MRFIRALVIWVAVISLYGAETPAAKDILRRSIKINEADWNTMPRYSYLERDITQKLDAKGHAKSETSKSFEAQMIEGSPYNKLVAVNGKPLSALDQRKEENKIKTETWVREHESTKIRILRIAKFRLEWRANHDLMKEMVDAFDVTLAGEETLNGHDVYVLEAVPRPGYRPSSMKMKILTAARAKFWVDKKEYPWARVEAEVMKPVTIGLVANVGIGTHFDFEQEPAGPNLWLPTRFVEAANITVLGLKHYRIREEEIFSHFKLPYGTPE
jgi:hypothetical protein